MYYMNSKYDSGGDKRQHQQQKIPEQPQQPRNNRMYESPVNVVPPQTWDAAFRRTEIQRLVSMPSSSTNDSAPASPYPSRDSNSYNTSAQIPCSLDLPGAAKVDANHPPLYRSYIQNNNNSFNSKNPVQNYAPYNHNIETARFPIGFDYENIRYSGTSMIPAIHKSFVESPTNHRLSRANWMDQQSLLQQQLNCRPTPPGSTSLSMNYSPSRYDFQPTSIHSHFPVSFGSTGMANVPADTASDRNDNHSQPLDLKSNKPGDAMTKVSVSGDNGFSVPQMNYFHGRAVLPTKTPLSNNISQNFSASATVDTLASLDVRNECFTKSASEHKVFAELREDMPTSTSSFDEESKDQTLQPNRTTLFSDTIDITLKEKKVTENDKSHGKLSSINVVVNGLQTEEKRPSMTIATPASASEYSLSTDESNSDKRITDVTTPKKFDFSSCDVNECCEAAKMLQFLQVHSPSTESIAEVTRMNVEYIEQLNTRIHPPSQSSSECENGNAGTVEKKGNESKVEDSATKKNRRIKVGKRLNDERDPRKKAANADVPMSTSQLPVPDLRQEIPPWHKLVQANGRVARIEDRDELFLADGEEQNDISERARMLKDSDFIAKARASIDPSFDALFVAMAQMIPCELNADDQNSAITSYKNHEIGFAGLCCRHCGGRPGSGRYFPNSVRSLSQTTTAMNMIKHFVNASNVVPDDIVKVDNDSAEALSKISNDSENARLEFTKKGKVQRIGGKHCTHCPYSVWLWLTEFQRRQTGVKSVTSSEGTASIQESKILGPSVDASTHQEGGGQRVRYGARKIFYSRVWKRMNKSIDQRKDSREDRSDSNVYPTSGNEDSYESESSSNSKCSSTSMHANFKEVNSGTKGAIRKRQSQPLSTASTKVGKKLKMSKNKSKSMISAITGASDAKNDITFLDLTQAEKPTELISRVESGNGDSLFVNQNKERKRTTEWEV